MPHFEAWPFAICLVASLALGVLLTFLMRLLGPRVGMVDHPVGRKDHARPTPLLGGVAVYLAATAGYVATAPLDRHSLWVFLGGALVLGLGVWDDRVGLRARFRLLVQLLAASGVFFAGMGFGWFPWAPANYALTVVWLVGMMNAMNCLDCADGIAAGVAAIAAAGFAVVAISYGHFAVALMAVALVGSCLGFLTLNFAPASIFLGDAGSMSLGLILGTIAITSSHGAQPWHHVWVVGLPLALPVWDIALVHLRRYRAGTRGLRALLESSGRDHLPHRLRHLGLSPRMTAVAVYAMAVTLMVPGVLIAGYQLDSLMLAGEVALLFLLVGERPFGEAIAGVSDRLRRGPQGPVAPTAEPALSLRTALQPIAFSSEPAFPEREARP